MLTGRHACAYLRPSDDAHFILRVRDVLRERGRAEAVGWLIEHQRICSYQADRIVCLAMSEWALEGGQGASSAVQA